MRKHREGADSQQVGHSARTRSADEARIEREARAPVSSEGRPAGRPAAGASDDALVSFGRSVAFESDDPFDSNESFDAHDVARRRASAGVAGANDDASGGGRAFGGLRAGGRSRASAAFSAAAGGDEAASDVYTRTSQAGGRSKRRTSPFRFDSSAPEDAERSSASQRPARSLKGRATAYLSRREYSRAELARKLAPYVEEGDDLESLLDALEREGWLSDARFAESLVHRRSARVGSARIVSELKRHAVGDALVEAVSAQLRENEFERAESVWRKKFGAAPQTPAERAKQARFLAMRGFSSVTIAKLLKGDVNEFGGD
ncbi:MULTISPECIES: recombination regulator RecX [Burkholderia]|uniref:Regulatory protein RecX n=1 Tax=Burkholderia mayonis TaxID=1385591 RepID=A0A1B4FBL4_9BURK|nr:MULTISPECIES: recombination regulator RecX [Burkholderia]AOJ01073.1 recombination regulator RecX [Burkholderia mayonis]KVE35415.1 recombination regulator RecX [Burkholderia sp. BDU5]KVE49925.1 recombination regulator RecX [Burkholderia mayonis]